MTDWQVPQSWSGQITLAAERIKGRIRPTPVTELSPGIFLKREDLQRTGSFKDRGVWNSILETQPGAGHIATTSSGNTAIACAWATAQLGLDLTVYLPIPSRLGAAELSGPRVRIVDMSATTFSNASRIAEREASENGALYISPAQASRSQRVTAPLVLRSSSSFRRFAPSWCPPLVAASSSDSGQH